MKSAFSLKFLSIVALAAAGVSMNAVLTHALSRSWETALALASGSLAGAVLLLWACLGVNRGKRERATRENDARYKMLFDVHPIPMWIFDAETFRFLAVNPAAMRDYGYAEAEFLRMSTLDIRSPLERVRLAAYLKSRPAHGKASGAMEAGIWQHMHKSGAIIHAEISYSHLTFEGRPAYVVLANNVTARMSAEDAAQRSNQMLASVIDSIPQRVFWKDRESRYLGCNRAFARDAGLAFPEQVIGRRDASLPWANYAAGISAIDQEVLSAGVAQIGYEVELEIQGIAHTVVASTLPLTDGGGHVIGILGTYSDITARKRAELALRLQSRALDASVNAILITVATDNGDLIEYVNPAFRRITGYEPSEVIGLDCKFLQRDDCDQEGIRAIREALRAGREITAVLRNYRKDGALFWNQLYIAPVPGPDGVVTHHISVINDVTELIRYQEQLEYQANYDGLTRLPNRNLLRDRLAHALSRARLEGTRVAVVFLDLDGFKNVNDSLGHSVGDKLLVAIGERLAACARGTDTVARHGGDEFVMLLDNAADNASLANWLDRVRGTVAEPIRLQGMELYVGCSLGVSMFPEDGDDAETLLQKADVAMYRAKELGRNSFQFYQPEMNASASARLDVETRLRRALRDGEFLLHYQPQVDVRTLRIIGLEALIRWQDPDIGLISPASFIPVAEDSGLIAEIGEWVMREACRQNKAWQDAGLPPVRMSVNVSAKQFDRRDIASLVRSILAQTGLDARYLELELTESAIMRNAEDAVATLAELHALGIGLSIDDFGTGYSSLSFLKRFPVDRLKIDRSFVSDIGWSEDDESITTAIIMLGHSLAMKVLAEGVETGAQLDFLRERHCDEMQGFHFARPMPAQAVADLLQGHFEAQRPADLEDRVSA